MHDRLYCAEIVLTLQYLHDHGVIHRSIRPESILLSSGGHVRMIAFDYAKRIKDRTFTLCGAPDYIAPEIIQGTGYGRGADWWAFGIMMYELLVGYPPFFAKTPFEVYQKILEANVSFGIVKLGHSEQLIRRLLKLNRKKRLGCGASGAEAVKNDAFFSANDGVDWSAVYEQQVVPPFVPELSGDADTRYFDLQPYDLFEMDASTDLTGEARQLWSKIPDS